MCLQCIVNSEVVIPNLFPDANTHFELQINEDVENDEWPKGWYGIVNCNDPSAVFPGPLREITDENFLDVMYDQAYVISDRNVWSLRHAWQFVQAAITAGYDPKEGSVEEWFITYCWEKLKMQEQQEKETAVDAKPDWKDAPNWANSLGRINWECEDKGKWCWCNGTKPANFIDLEGRPAPEM